MNQRFRFAVATLVGVATSFGFSFAAHAESSPATLGAGYSHTCARRADGSLWCWGANESGQLGNNTTTPSAIPQMVTALGTSVAKFAVGDSFTCAIKFDGTLWCWGNNVSGQLGDGLTDDNLVPNRVTALGNDVAEVSASDLFACARKGDGTAWCWGGGGFLGDGTTNNRLLPVQITPLGNTVAQISTGSAAACARKTDGTLWCWGDNEYGIVGDGTLVDRLSPVQVTSLGATVAEVSVGDLFACVRKTDGNVFCWGTNDHGQLGDGSTNDHLLPAAVIGLGKPAVQISANGRHACAVRNDGQLGCWGANNSGEVGDGTLLDRVNPAKTALLANNVVEVSAGINQDTCARTSDGRIYCWGFNGTGQLGDGTQAPKKIPTQALGPDSPASVPAGSVWSEAALLLLLAGVAMRRLRATAA
jgi:alpha-tubulin suppressor-like RCC1 family protein